MISKLNTIRPANQTGAAIKSSMLAIARRVWMLRAQRPPAEAALIGAAASMRSAPDPTARAAAANAVRLAAANLGNIDGQIFRAYTPTAAENLNRALARLQSSRCDLFAHPLPAAPSDIRLTPAEKRKAEAARHNAAAARTDNELTLWTVCTTVGLKGAIEAFKSWAAKAIGGQILKDIPTDLCSLGTAGFSGFMWMNEHAAGREASDPPRLDFRVVAGPPKPRILHISGPPSQAEAAASFERLLNALYREAWLRNTLVTSLERAQGAYQANSLTYVRRQRSAARRIALAAATAVRNRLAAQASVVKDFRAAGIYDAFNLIPDQAPAFAGWRSSHAAALDGVLSLAGAGLLTRSAAIADLTLDSPRSTTVTFPEVLNSRTSRSTGRSAIATLKRIASSMRKTINS